MCSEAVKTNFRSASRGSRVTSHTPPNLTIVRLRICRRDNVYSFVEALRPLLDLSKFRWCGLRTLSSKHFQSCLSWRFPGLSRLRWKLAVVCLMQLDGFAMVGSECILGLAGTRRRCNLAARNAGGTQTRLVRNLSRHKYHLAFRGPSMRLISVKTRAAAEHTRTSEASVAAGVEMVAK